MTRLESHRGSIRRIIGSLFALALVALVLALARPAAVFQLLRTTDFGGLLPAALAAAGALLFRGIRLVLLLPRGRLSLPTATSVAATAQAAALFIPARVGELALPILLRRVAGSSHSAGIGTLLAVRTLDTATLGIWAGASVLAVFGIDRPLALVAALCLLIPPLLLPGTLAVADRIAVRILAVRGVRGRRWARRVRRVRQSVSSLGDRPLNLLGAFCSSLAMWAFLWSLAWYLLVAMGYRWPPSWVVAGSATASLSNLLPVNFVGNFGTLEAGWTAAFVALGIPPETAAATGFASHLWALVFAAVYGAIGWTVLATRR